MKLQAPHWTNPSVLQFASGHDPVAVMAERARSVVFRAMVEGWVGPHATSALFEDLVEQEDLNCNYRHEGYYEIYLTERGLRLAESEASLVRRYGYHPESVPGDKLRQRNLSINNQVVGGIYHPEAATLNPYLFVREMAERARRHGARFQTGSEVLEITTGKG